MGNPILEEIYAAREQLLAEAGGDLKRLVEQTQERQAKSGHRIVTGPVGDADSLKTRAPVPGSKVIGGESAPAAH